MQNPFLQPTDTRRRSGLLTTLCVLTFIGSGLAFLSNFYYTIAFDQALTMLENMSDEDTFSSISDLLVNTVDHARETGRGLYLIHSFLFAGSLVGAVMMWKGRKSGIHVYGISQIVLLFTPMLFGLIRFPSLFSALITLTFIALYANGLGLFERKEQADESSSDQ